MSNLNNTLLYQHFSKNLDHKMLCLMVIIIYLYWFFKLLLRYIYWFYILRNHYNNNFLFSWLKVYFIHLPEKICVAINWNGLYHDPIHILWILNVQVLLVYLNELLYFILSRQLRYCDMFYIYLYVIFRLLQDKNCF